MKKVPYAGKEARYERFRPLERVKRRTLSKMQREWILQLALNCPDEATAVAVNMGLSPKYAYKLARERGLLPLKLEYREPKGLL